MEDTLKRKMCILLLLEEEAEEEYCALHLLKYRKRRKVDEMFLKRRQEGAFKLLIEPRLSDNDNKFREYFRVNKELFATVLSYIECDIARNPYNRQHFPISPKEKLCITLR